jgi:hypothetical protein
MAARCGLIVHGLIVTFLFASDDVDDNLQAEAQPVDALDAVSTVTNWIYAGIATWYGAAIIGGGLILLFERLDRRREPSDADVRRAAARYREWYGEDAFRAIGDHMLAASFAPDSRHRRFLKRVSAELLATAVTVEDRTRAIEP